MSDRRMEWGDPRDKRPQQPGYHGAPGSQPGSQQLPPGFQPSGYGQQYGPPGYGYEEPPVERRRWITPFRIVVLLALVGSGAVVFYGLVLDKTGQAIAFTVAGLGIFGLTLATVALWLAAAGIRAARWGAPVRAILGGLFGGLFALAASGALAGAVILALLTRTV